VTLDEFAEAVALVAQWNNRKKRRLNKRELWWIRYRLESFGVDLGEDK
jgi:hypothetical protein